MAHSCLYRKENSADSSFISSFKSLTLCEQHTILAPDYAKRGTYVRIAMLTKSID